MARQRRLYKLPKIPISPAQDIHHRIEVDPLSIIRIQLMDASRKEPPRLKSLGNSNNLIFNLIKLYI